MHGDQCSGAPGGGQNANELAVVQSNRRIISEGNTTLARAADARRHDLRHLAKYHVVGRVGNDLMKAVIDHRFGGEAATCSASGVADAMAFEHVSRT